jgi:hypothetical protein
MKKFVLIYLIVNWCLILVSLVSLVHLLFSFAHRLVKRPMRHVTLATAVRRRSADGALLRFAFFHRCVALRAATLLFSTDV